MLNLAAHIKWIGVRPALSRLTANRTIPLRRSVNETCLLLLMIIGTASRYGAKTNSAPPLLQVDVT